MLNHVKIFAAAAFAFVAQTLCGWLGGFDPSLNALIVAMALDLITGVCVAAFFHKSRKSKNGRLSSAAYLRGFVKKLCELAMLAFCVSLDKAMGSATLRPACVLFLLGCEGLSLLENLAEMGVPFPAALRNALDVMQNAGEVKQNE